MGIFDFLKKKKDKAEPNVNSGNVESEVNQDRINEDDSKQDIFDDMSRKTFYRNEAAYRHQQIVLPRYKSETGVPLGDILTKLFPEVVSKIDSVTVLHTVQVNEVETKHLHITNAEIALAYDIFWNISYKNEEDDNIYPVTGTNITFIIRIKGENVPPYIVLFARGMAIGFEEVYIRITLMIPANVGKDDLRTSKSNSVPTMTSFLIACDKKDNPKQFEEYEEAEERVMSCIKNGVRLRDDIDAELYFGLGEFQPFSHFYGYGKYLYKNKRYDDASAILMRGINAMISHQDDVNNDFYEACRILARCLMHHNHYESAGYFYSLAYSGGVVSDDEYENFWVAIADSRSIDLLCANLVKKHGEDFDKWTQESKERYNKVYNLYKNNCDEDKKRSDKVAFYSDLGLGLVLMRLLNIEESKIGGMNVILPDGIVSSIMDKEQIRNESLYKYLIPGTTIVLSYSRAYYATGDNDDQSILCHASSIIIYVDSANEAEKLVRVNIMIPNFTNDDDKHDMSKTNDPISISFIMSSVDDPKLVGEDNLDTIYDYANNCVRQYRFYEAHMAYLFIYKKLSVKRLTLTDEEKQLFYRSAYCVGFCYEELQNHEKALFYLDMANNAGLDTYEQEFINALVNSRDPRALSVIKDAKKKKYNVDLNSEAFQTRNAFLNRREAYVLIDLEKYDEAETLLKEMLNNPMSKEFAEGELKYVEQMKQQRS